MPFKKKSSSKRSGPQPIVVRVVVQKSSGKPNYRRKKRSR